MVSYILAGIVAMCKIWPGWRLLLRLRQLGCEVLRWTCWSVCLCVRSRISNTTWPNSRKISVRNTVAVARFCSDDCAICYVAYCLLWMTLCLPIRTIWRVA